MKRASILLFVVCAFALRAFGQEQSVKVSPCELLRDPASYNHKLIEITGFIRHAFEDFTLYDPDCERDFVMGVWLEYGGTNNSGTMYCCGVGNERSRPKELKIEGVAVPLVEDEKFQLFDKLVQRTPSAMVHATLMGRFFAGSEVSVPGKNYFRGFGHMGCCSLLAIERVNEVDPQTRTDVDYSSEYPQPNLTIIGCGFRSFVRPFEYELPRRQQKEAEASNDPKLFSDPAYVATRTLAMLAKVPESEIQLKQTKGGAALAVYEWQRDQKHTYMIVATKPYWLSFFANDSGKVAWTTPAVYVSSCDKNNSIKRIK